MTGPLSDLSKRLAEIAYEAGLIVLKHYAQSTAVRTKADSSPVTAADEEAEALIVARLHAWRPQLQIVAEEAMAGGAKPQPKEQFFLVDPLDGTKEFVKRNGEFTVNIALVRDCVPVAGVVHAPALERMFVGDETAGAFEIPVPSQRRFDLDAATRIGARVAPEDGLIAAISRTHGDTRTDEYLAAYDIAKIVTIGSSLKFCLIAAGEADLYPRHGPTMEWDTAAGHAVLRAAGGRVTKLDGSAFLYGKIEDGFRNGSFIARGLA